MTYEDVFYSAGFLADLIIIASACRARCWLLVAGMLLRVPVDIQVVVHKFQRIAGIPSDDPSFIQIVTNRTLVSGALVLMTIAMIQLLLRYARLQRSAAAPHFPAASE